MYSQAGNTLSIHEGKVIRQGKVIDSIPDMKSLNIFLAKSKSREQLYKEVKQCTGDGLKLMEMNFEPRHRLIQKCIEERVNYCDVNRMGYNFINYIHKEYPQARFVHVVRNGYTCIDSWRVRLGGYPTKSVLKQYIFGRNPIEIPRKLINLLSYHSFLESQLSQVTANKIKKFNKNNPWNYITEKPLPYEWNSIHTEWPTLDRYSRTAWYWDFVNQSIKRDFEGIPDDQKLVIRLEDFEISSILDLLKFSGIDDTSGIMEVEKLNNRKSARAVTLPSDKKQIFQELCSQSMGDFGYELQ